MAISKFDRTAESKGQDDDAPLARDLWFAQQLGEEWQEEEPGIYRYLGSRRADAGGRSATAEPVDAVIEVEAEVLKRKARATAFRDRLLDKKRRASRPRP